MGGFSPLPELSDEETEHLVEVVHRPILAELARRGATFRGALFANLLFTAEGPALLECNARFGDPEAQLVLPRVAVPLAPFLAAAATDTLAEAARGLGLVDRSLPVNAAASAGIVLAAAGYPGRPRSGDPIDGLGAAQAVGALVFHAGTVADDAGRYWTSGGRVLTVVGLGDDPAAAHALADRAADMISFDGRQRRRDFLSEPTRGGTAPAAIGAAR
jgi:phosphoribosylamine--glycine ligase